MALERKIAEILKDDARRTPAQIAAMLGEDETTVKSCIRAMEESGKIVKYTAIVEETDESGVEALIEVKVTPKKGEGFDGIARDIAEMHQKGEHLRIRGYGLLHLPADCDEEQLYAVVDSIEVRGKVSASQAVKNHYGLK